MEDNSLHTSSFFLTSFFFLLLDASSPSHSSPEPELELLLDEEDLDLQGAKDKASGDI